MTTPATQPPLSTLRSSPRASRKRPHPDYGHPAPPPPPSPYLAGVPPPVDYSLHGHAGDGIMNYTNGSSTSGNGGSDGSLNPANIFDTSYTLPTSQDPQNAQYRNQQQQQQQQNAQQQQDIHMFGAPQQQQQQQHDNQLTRVTRGSHNQLIRMPSYSNGLSLQQMPPGMGMPTGGMGQIGQIGQMGMNGIGGMAMMGQPGAGQLMHQPTMYNPHPQDVLDEELDRRIKAARKDRQSIPPFVLKLSSFVNDPKTDHLIRWSPSGTSFMVLDEDEFSKTLIPDLFKHNNYASFVRQLNMYGFHKKVGLADGSLKTSEQRSKPPSEYENPYFKRGQPDLLWLIQKPKSKKSGRGRGKVKTEDVESDKEDSDTAANVDGGRAGGYIEGSKPTTPGSKKENFDMSHLVSQLEAVRNHQATISSAIQRLRNDHQQLYEQSLAFQSLHDRHENSINAILTFLATVYDKSLGGHINNGAVTNLLAHQMGQDISHPHNLQTAAQAMHRGASSTGNSANNTTLINNPSASRNGVLRTPVMPRRRLLLDSSHQQLPPDTPDFLSSSTSANYQPPTSTIEELFTPPGGSGSIQAHNSPTITNADSPTTNPASPPPSATSNPTFSPTSLLDSPTPNPNPPSPLQSLNHLPRGLRALASPLASHAQALKNHHAQMAQKSSQIEELQSLQEQQSSQIDQLVGMVSAAAAAKTPNPTPVPTPITTEPDSTAAGMVYGVNGISGDGVTGPYGGVPGLEADPEQFLDWGDIPMGMVPGLDVNGPGLDELLKMGGSGMEGMDMEIGEQDSPETVGSGETGLGGGSGGVAKVVVEDVDGDEGEVEIRGGEGHGVKRRKVA